ncbi:carotenoid oxygenase family protein [Zavarzinia sp. CC-PAN008]|uniref:carotenoid oxygenase family protein n=1 Tax=Zavarzinia sp. CC-PAN008 TaxID=3243332 RepID=UPI003F74ABE4
MAKPFPKHPYLSGNFAPLRQESDAPDLVIHGEMPRDLAGSLYRIGPNPQFAPKGDHHWFVGDGMVHAFHIEDGRVDYRNRWVRTGKFELERQHGRALYDGFNPMGTDPVAQGTKMNVANTNVLYHGGRLLALEEGNLPVEMGWDSLDTVGPWDFDGKVSGPVTAHPKIDGVTGEMLFFGYQVGGFSSPEMSFHIADAAGRITHAERFEAPFASMVHDFVVTAEHVIFPIFPCTASIERAMKGLPALAWEPEKGSHIGIMPRHGSVADMRWFTGPAAYVYHPMNAFTEGSKVMCDMVRYDRVPLFPNADGSMTRSPIEGRLVRWTFDLAGNSDTYTEEVLSDLAGEFPRLDERLTGRAYRHGYMATATNGRTETAGSFDSLAHVDLKTGRQSVYRLPAGDVPGEPVFVPRSASAAEGDGWLLATVYRGAEHRSDLLVLDATDVAAGPVAVAELPARVPFGFHGNWRSAV